MLLHTVRGQIELHEAKNAQGVKEKFILVKYKGAQVIGRVVTDQEIEELHLLQEKDVMAGYRDALRPRHVKFGKKKGNGKKKKDLLKNLRLAEINELADM